MKKLILALLIPFIPYFAHADTVTSGPIGLLMVSTGVVGTRNWGDKYNENFHIIANSMTAVLNAAFAAQTPPVSIYDNTGTFLGNATTVKFNSNLTTNMVGSTATVNGSAGGGGGAVFGYISTRTINMNSFGISNSTGLELGQNLQLTTVLSTITLAIAAAGGGKIPTLQSPATGPYVLTSDAGVRFGIAASSGLEYGAGAQITTFLSTSDARGNTFVNFRSTTDALFNTVISTLMQVRTDTGTLALALSQRTVVAHDGVTPLGGIVTDLNCAGCTQVGSTLTFPASAAAAATVSSGPRIYSLVCGTQDAVGVDVFVTSITNFNLILSSIAATGLTTSATGYGQLFFRDGVYKISNATIPAGVTIVCGSSVTFVDELVGVTQFSVYGKMQNCNYDMNATARSAKVIRMKSSSQLTGFKIYNFPAGQGTASGGTFALCTLCVEASSNVKLQGDFSNFLINNDQLRHGDQAPFMILDSTNVDIQVNANFGSSIGSSSTFLFFGRSKTINYHDSTFLNAGGNSVVVGPGNQDIFYERNKIQITQTAGGLGHVVFTGDSGPAFGLVSTGTVSFSYNDWDIQTSDAGNIFEFDTGGNGRMSGVRIKDNTVHRILATGGTYTFANIASTIAGGTILQGNNMAGLTTFIVDGGDKTLYISQGNTLNNVEQ